MDQYVIDGAVLGFGDVPGYRTVYITGSATTACTSTSNIKAVVKIAGESTTVVTPTFALRMIGSLSGTGLAFAWATTTWNVYRQVWLDGYLGVLAASKAVIAPALKGTGATSITSSFTLVDLRVLVSAATVAMARGIGRIQGRVLLNGTAFAVGSSLGVLANRQFLSSAVSAIAWSLGKLANRRLLSGVASTLVWSFGAIYRRAVMTGTGRTLVSFLATLVRRVPLRGTEASHFSSYGYFYAPFQYFGERTVVVPPSNRVIYLDAER